MSKVIISKRKRDKIESMVLAVTAAIAMLAAKEGRITDGMIAMRERVMKEIMDILDNK